MLKTKGLLDQLLRSGQELMQQKTGAQSTQGRGQGFQLGNLLSGGGRGAVATGAIGLLLGSKTARKMGGKIIAYGGLAALGVIAYKAFNALQQQNEGAALNRQPQTVDRLSEQEAELHSRAILRALIGAAKADGHIDDRERQLVHNEMEKLTGDQELKMWFDQELNKPLDPAEIAQSATSPEIAAEMYLASLLMVDEQNFMERSYLDELARQMKLDPSLRAELEKQAMEA
jgi:uncharacterized membrane protein YebE (DUF533 family)